MDWLVLLLASMFEIGWAVGLKFSDGLTRFWPAVATVVAMIMSFVLLSQAVRTIPLGTAYVVWTGIGAMGAAVFGVVAFNEPLTIQRVIFLACILVGVLGLKATS